MRVLKQYPPNHKEISRVFGRGVIENAVFTYGDIVYSPKNDTLPPDLIAHEEEHERQQSMSHPEVWWDEYLRNPEFRANQELAAYVAQYRYACQHYPRHERRRLLKGLSSDLSGPMYGRVMTKAEAEIKIKGGV